MAFVTASKLTQQVRRACTRGAHLTKKSQARSRPWGLWPAKAAASFLHTCQHSFALPQHLQTCPNSALSMLGASSWHTPQMSVVLGASNVSHGFLLRDRPRLYASPHKLQTECLS